MQLRPEALDGHLAKGLAPLYVITSDEHLLALEAADKIRRAARAQGYSERDVLTVERNFKWGELLAANQAMSLFGDKKLIELRIPGGKPGKDGSAALQNYAKDLNPDNLTLVTLPKLDWQTAKASWVAARLTTVGDGCSAMKRTRMTTRWPGASGADSTLFQLIVPVPALWALWAGLASRKRMIDWS